MSNFIDNDISLFINNKNKDKFFKDFNDNLKDKKRDLRISNKKLRDNGIYFESTEEAISRCIREFK